MSKFKLEFTLKQHTPLIHFQADQSGATLRATELKPKLDRFLLTKLGEGDYEKGKEEAKKRGWLIGKGEHPALDYKVKILHEGENQIDFPKPFVKRGTNGYVAPYFADGKSIEHDKTINLTISSFKRDILEAIEKNIPLFFTFENFGTRQSKGFGSYHLSSTTNDEFQELIKQHENPVFHFTSSSKTSKEALRNIDFFYRKIKAGLNPKANHGKHFKSLLFEYMCTKDSGWEKRWIKEKFPEVVYGEHKPIDCKPPKEYHYIRALLGLAELNEYYPYGQSKKLQIKIEGVKRDPSDKKKALYQRFKSPLTFKIFNNQVYVIHNESYKEILGEEFYFMFKKEKEKLALPQEFKIYEFLQFVASKTTNFEELS